KKVITLKSDNPDYDDIDISEEMQEYFKINGRVVEVISKKRVL
ncbi:MAG: helix-turn-helix transcriptional regulator, partial [Parvimonas sp.]|nr:helix-turn-helix transcriptional regulator [Parvimonas sp.]